MLGEEQHHAVKDVRDACVTHTDTNDSTVEVKEEQRAARGWKRDIASYTREKERVTQLVLELVEQTETSSLAIHFGLLATSNQVRQTHTPTHVHGARRA
jgi:hypothetical protein